MFFDKKPTKKEIEEYLFSIKNVYNEIGGYYALDEKEINIKDKRQKLGTMIQDFLDSNQTKIDNKITKLDNSHAESLKFIKKIETMDSILSEQFDNKTKYEFLAEYLNNEELEDIKNKAQNMKDAWNSIFGDNKDLHKEYEDACSDIIDSYNNLFSEKNGESKINKIDKIFNDLQNKYEILSKGKEDESGKITKSYFDEIKEKRQLFNSHTEKLNIFYSKIFGAKDQKSLNGELEDRMAKLGTIEEEAKKIIGLSSIAGLAGGFVERGKKAKINKLVSASIFIAVLISLFCFNIWILPIKLENISLDYIAIRVIVNSPFVWIAIVSNINLNKYSRLEEEYSHKEALAKSFNQYKKEISENTVEDSEEMLKELLQINIEAFKLNPAETMKHGKSDLPNIFSKNKKS